MNKWKRGLALLLAAAMSLALFSGCGQSGEALSLSVCAGGPPEELDHIIDQAAALSLALRQDSQLLEALELWNGTIPVQACPGL